MAIYVDNVSNKIIASPGAFTGIATHVDCCCNPIGCNSCSPALKDQYDLALSGDITVNGCSSHNYTWTAGTYTVTWVSGCTWALGGTLGDPYIYFDWIGVINVWRIGFNPYFNEGCHSDWFIAGIGPSNACTPTNTGIPFDNTGTTCGCTGATVGSQSVTIDVTET